MDNYDVTNKDMLTYLRGPFIVWNITSIILNFSLIVGVRLVNIFNPVNEYLVLIYNHFQDKPVFMFPWICVNFTVIVILITAAVSVFTIPGLPVGEAFIIFFIVLLALGKYR